MPIVPLLTFGGGGSSGYTPNFPHERGEARVVVEVAWGFTAETLNADLTWTDETDRAIQIDTDSGRSSAYELTPAGRATIVLKNTDRRYDPTHTTGPLYASINGKIGHPVRVRAIYGDTSSGTTVDIWRGFVDRIDQGWDVQYAEKYATAVLTCSDAIAELSTATLPDSPWQVEVLRGVKFEDDGSAVPDPPIHQWRLGEATGTICRDSTTLTSPAALNGTYVTTGTNPVTYNYRAALTKGSPDGAIQFIFTNGDHVTLPSGTWTPPFTVVARLVLVDNDAINPILLIDPAGSAQFYFGVTSSNFLTVTFHDGTNTRSATASTTALEIGTAYTVACVVLANAAPKLYVATGSTVTGDLAAGFETVTASGSGTLSGITGTGYIGRSGSSYMWGVLDEITVFDYDASALEGYGGSPLTRLDDYHDVAVDAWDEDTFQLRTKKILDAVFWPTDMRVISTTSTWEYDPAEFTGSSAMQYLQEVARSEDGLIWVGPDGKVHCEDRRERYVATRSTVSQATIGDAASGASARYFACIADGQDRSWVRQRIVARRKGGSDIIAQDPTFKRGESEDLGTLMLRDESNVQAFVDRRLTQRKTPAQRFTQVTWTPRRNNQYALLERTISDRVTIKKTPQGVGSEISQASWIEGISHSINKRTARWDVTWRVSPCLADPD